MASMTPPKQVRISQDGIFYTLQGEGPLVGVPSLFVRLDTCNLRCKWGQTECDAAYTSWRPGSLRMDIDELVLQINHQMTMQKCRHVVITGGEPMLQAEAVQAICRSVIGRGGHTTIETNGTIQIGCAADLICLSPKLRSSTPFGTKYQQLHTENRWNPSAIRFLMEHYSYYFKFVIDHPQDYHEVFTMLAEVGQRLPDSDHVVFMPQGINQDELIEKGKWIAEDCKEFGVRFSPRLQIAIWGNKAGT